MSSKKDKNSKNNQANPNPANNSPNTNAPQPQQPRPEDIKKPPANVKIVTFEQKYFEQVRSLYKQEANSTVILRGIDLLHYLFRTHKKTKMSIALTIIYILGANFCHHVLQFEVESYKTLGTCFLFLILLLGWIIPGYQRFFVNIKQKQVLNSDLLALYQYYIGDDKPQEQSEKMKEGQKEQLKFNNFLLALEIEDKDNTTNKNDKESSQNNNNNNIKNDEKVVGFIALDSQLSPYIENNQERKLVSGKKQIEVKRLCVGPEDMRHRGVGEKLLQKAEIWARDKGYDLMVLHMFSTNEPAVKLFEKCQFKQTDFSYYNYLMLLCGLQTAIYTKVFSSELAQTNNK